MSKSRMQISISKVSTSVLILLVVYKVCLQKSIRIEVPFLKVKIH